MIMINNPIKKQSNTSSKSDKYSFWYTIWTGAVFFLMYLSDTLDRLFNLWLLIVPIMGIPFLIWFIVMFIALCKNIYKMHWRQVVSIIAAPTIAWVIFPMINSLDIPDQIRLEHYKSTYMKEVADIQVTDDSPRLKTWDWGGTGGAAVPNIFYTLVYDDSDQITLPQQSRIDTWEKSFAKTKKPWILNVEKGKSITIKHLDDHFYLIKEIYQ